MVTKVEALKLALDAVAKDRPATYGSPLENFDRTALLWSAHLGQAITASDVAIMMVLLKVARLRATPGHVDSWVDIAGYAACGVEVTHAPMLGVRAVGEVLGLDPMGVENMGDA